MLAGVPRSLPDFDALWDAYPHGNAAAVKATIGGNVDASWISNTCTIRISRCFNAAGHPLPRNHAGLTTVRGGDDLRYAFRVREFVKFMNEVYGPPAVVVTAERGISRERFQGRRGLIAFDVKGWPDATGHIDLWDGARCANHGYFSRAWKVSLWESPPS